MTTTSENRFGPHLVDGREMEAPEPMERTLAGLDILPAGEELVLLLYCSPHPLFQMLRRNGYVWTEQREEDGTNVIRIRAA